MNNSLYADQEGNLIEVSRMDTEIVEFSSQGGGFLKRCSRQEFDRLFKPANEPEYSRMVVGAEWLDQTIACYSNGKRWNGWGMPLFPFESAQLLCSLMPDIHHDADQDAFVWEPKGEESESYSAQTINYQGASIKVYGIGAGSWCWDACEPATTE